MRRGFNGGEGNCIYEINHFVFRNLDIHWGRAAGLLVVLLDSGSVLYVSYFSLLLVLTTCPPDPHLPTHTHHVVLAIFQVCSSGV